METNPQNRLAMLFGDSSVPLSASSQKTQQAQSQSQRLNIHDDTLWSQAATMSVKPEHGPINSSDNNDYISALTDKPTMRPLNSTADNLEVGQDVSLAVPHGLSNTAVTASVLPRIDEYGDKAIAHFCLLNLVSQLPYRYFYDPGDHVAQKFFFKGKFNDRKWHIYYLYPHPDVGDKPVLMVPRTQCQKLIDEINTAFNSDLVVPGSPFTISFYNDSTPQPVFLKNIVSRGQFKGLMSQIPANVQDYAEVDDTLFRDKSEKIRQALEDAIAASSKRANAKFQKLVASWTLQLERVQRHLGLLPPPTQPADPPANVSWAEETAFRAAEARKCSFNILPYDASMVAPFVFEKEPIIVSIDFEAYERGQHLITEIGVSTLDVLDLAEIPPGPAGEDWIKQIRSRHFRIRGRAHLVNRKYCIGNPDGFQYGQTEWVNLRDAPLAFDSCFQWPFSCQFKQSGLLGLTSSGTGNTSASNGNDDGGGLAIQSNVISRGPTNAQQHAAKQGAVFRTAHEPLQNSSTNASKPQLSQRGGRDRNILLLGHALSADIAYLTTLGSGMASFISYPYLPQSSTSVPIIDTLDTGNLYQALKGETQQGSLAAVLAGVGGTASHPHNAGNDARYTLEALIGIAIKARLQGDERRKEGAAKQQETEEAEARAAAASG